MVLVPQGARDAPGDQFLPAIGALQQVTRRVAPFARYTVPRRTALLTGHALRHMKQVNISDPWYNMAVAFSGPSNTGKAAQGRVCDPSSLRGRYRDQANSRSLERM